MGDLRRVCKNNGNGKDKIQGSLHCAADMKPSAASVEMTRG